MRSAHTQASFPKTALHVPIVVVLGALLASIAITGCVQSNPYKERDNVPPTLATKSPLSTSRPTAENPRSIATTLPHPTQTIQSTVADQMTQIPRPTFTPYPTSTPYPTPTQTQVTTYTPTPTPAHVPGPSPTPVPALERPIVSGYLLMVNGANALPHQVSISIENGHIMVSPMTNDDGSYPKGTEVTLGYYPDRSTDVVYWSGVDISEGPIARVFMDRDREVIATIGP